MNKSGAIFTVIIACLLGVYAVAEIAMDDMSLQKMAAYLSILAFLLPLFSPWLGFQFLILLAAYPEMIKVLAFWQSSRYLDLVLLNLPPVCGVAGLSVVALLQLVLGRVEITRALIVCWALAILGGMALGAKTLLGGEGTQSMGDAVNVSAYLMMMPVVATLVRRQEDVRKIISSFLWVMLPAALYGIWQALFGFPTLHMSYLAVMRGLVDMGQYIQPSGTMNGAISFGTVMALCFCLLVVRARLKNKVSAWDVVFALIYLSATAVTVRRSAWLLIAGFIVGLIFFRTYRRTAVLYAGSVALLISLYVFSMPLLNLCYSIHQELQSRTSHEFASRVLNVGTWTDRFLGFYNMTRNERLWTLFGADLGEDYGRFGVGRGEEAGALARLGNFEAMRDDFVHDGFNKAIISYGVIPVFSLLVIMALVVHRVHRVQFRTRDSNQRRLLLYHIALMFGIGTTILTSQQALIIFPINMVVFTITGFFVHFYSQAVRSLRSGPAGATASAGRKIREAEAGGVSVPAGLMRQARERQGPLPGAR